MNIPIAASDFLLNEHIKIVIAICVFLNMVLLSLTFIKWKKNYKKNLSTRLQDIKRPVSEEGMQQKYKGQIRKINHRIAISKHLFAYLKLEKNWAILLEKQLLQASIPLRVEELLIGEAAVNLVLTTVVFVLTHDWIASFLVFILILLAPFVWIKIAKQKRLKQFNSQIGESLDIISNSLKAGYGFLYAMEIVGKEMSEPIAKEFSRVIQEINLGMATEQALKNMANRVGSEDFDLVVTALLIQRQVGGNLAEVLDNISKTIRERVRICGEIKTLTAQGRVSGIIVGALPIALGIILYFVNPAYMRVLFKHPLGLAMVGGGILNIALGTLLIKKIITIEV